MPGRTTPLRTLTIIVRNNPKELTIDFGRPRRKAIGENCISMTLESIDADGSTNPGKIFNDLTETTTFYTYRSPTSRLPATRFIQTALTLMKKPHFENMRSRGLIQGDSAFARNSPGEYSALVAPAKVICAQSLFSVAFYRGLTMQVAVERNTEGRSNYSMIAVNPSRISWTSITEIFITLLIVSLTERNGCTKLSIIPPLTGKIFPLVM